MFLDEIGNLPLHLQPKLLTALEQRQVTPVGANKPVPIDIRVIAATNLPPERARATRASFRQDLLFRLNTVEIDLPPLRERREDIPLLIDHFIAHLCAQIRQAGARRCRPTCWRRSQAYDWPGNVRALRHAVERAVILAGDDAVHRRGFLAVARRAPARSRRRRRRPPRRDDLNLERAERQLVEEALKKHGYNISLAAAELGLTRASLYRRMEKHGLVGRVQLARA